MPALAHGRWAQSSVLLRKKCSVSLEASLFGFALVQPAGGVGGATVLVESIYCGVISRRCPWEVFWPAKVRRGELTPYCALSRANSVANCRVALVK